MFTAALFTIANAWKQPKCPSTTYRRCGTYVMKCYSAIKRMT